MQKYLQPVKIGCKVKHPHYDSKEIERLKACSQEIAEILYRNTLKAG